MKSTVVNHKHGIKARTSGHGVVDILYCEVECLYLLDNAINEMYRYVAKVKVKREYESYFLYRIEISTALHLQKNCFMGIITEGQAIKLEDNVLEDKIHVTYEKVLDNEIKEDEKEKEEEETIIIKPNPLRENANKSFHSHHHIRTQHSDDYDEYDEYNGYLKRGYMYNGNKTKKEIKIFSKNGNFKFL